jgi:hypothetical protein
MARPPKMQEGLPLYVRLPAATIKRLDAQLGRMTKAMPGLALSRSDAVRVAIARGLEALEAEGKR